MTESVSVNAEGKIVGRSEADMVRTAEFWADRAVRRPSTRGVMPILMENVSRHTLNRIHAQIYYLSKGKHGLFCDRPDRSTHLNIVDSRKKNGKTH